MQRSEGHANSGRKRAMGRPDRAAFGAAWSAGETVGRQGISLLIFALLARVLTPAEFGLFALLALVYGLMQCLVDDGIGEALVQRRDLHPAHITAAFWTNVVVAVSVALLCLLIAIPFLPALQPEFGWFVAVQGLVLCVSALGGVQLALLRREMRFRELAVRSWFSIVLGGCVGLGLAFSGYGIWSLLGQQLTERLMGTALLWRFSLWRPALSWSGPHTLELARYAGSTIVSRLAILAHNQADKLLVGALLGTASLGFYSIAARVMDAVILMGVLSLTRVALSSMSRLQHDRALLIGAFRRMLRAIAVLALPAFVGLSAIAPDLVPLIFGAEWQQAGSLLRLMALSGVAVIVHALVNTALRASGHPVLALALVAGEGAGNLLAAMLGATAGLEGAVTALVVNQYLFLVPVLWTARTYIGVSPLGMAQQIAPVGIACGAMAGFVWAGGEWFPAAWPPAVRLVAQIGLGAAIYAAALSAVSRSFITDLLQPFRRQSAVAAE